MNGNWTKVNYWNECLHDKYNCRLCTLDWQVWNYALRTRQCCWRQHSPKLILWRSHNHNYVSESWRLHSMLQLVSRKTVASQKDVTLTNWKGKLFCDQSKCLNKEKRYDKKEMNVTTCWLYTCVSVILVHQWHGGCTALAWYPDVYP